MCELCWQTPCASLCPNNPGPRAIYICSGCGETIYEGDYVWHILSEQFCESCIDDFREEAEYIE